MRFFARLLLLSPALVLFPRPQQVAHGLRRRRGSALSRCRDSPDSLSVGADGTAAPPEGTRAAAVTATALPTTGPPPQIEAGAANAAEAGAGGGAESVPRRAANARRRREAARESAERRATARRETIVTTVRAQCPRERHYLRSRLERLRDTTHISIRIAAPDGETVAVSVPANGKIADVTRALAADVAARGVAGAVVSLFVSGEETELKEERRLCTLDMGDAATLFMLRRSGMAWTEHGKEIGVVGRGALGKDHGEDLPAERTKREWAMARTALASREAGREGPVAVKLAGSDFAVATGGEPMVAGRHYWEVELTHTRGAWLLVGAVTAAHRSDGWYDSKAFNGPASAGCYFINLSSGRLFGEGIVDGFGRGKADKQGRFRKGDVVGMWADLDEGWLKFYRNGEQCRLGFEQGVQGPLLCAANLCAIGDAVTLLPGGGSVPPGRSE